MPIDKANSEKKLGLSAWGYQSLCNATNNFSPGMVSIIRNNRSTKIVEDIWLRSVRVVFKNHGMGITTEQPVMVYDLISSDNTWRASYIYIWRLFPPNIARNILATHLRKDGHDYCATLGVINRVSSPSS